MTGVATDQCLEDSPLRAARPRAGLRAVLVAMTLLVVALSAVVVVSWASRESAAPSDESPEAGFARDMQVHHAQAVEMAFLIRDRTTDPTIRTTAYDIITSQQQQMGQMFGWLTLWDLPQNSAAAPMTWMGNTSNHDMSQMSDMSQRTDEADRMPGMASDGQIQKLEDSRGARAEVIFLRLMINHHRGGIQMAQAALRLSENPDVRTLAAAIASSQAAEIEQMRQLLDARTAEEPDPTQP